ncbi:hypothetical protein C2G38_2172765 [Gigaspora rosea]|uniref:non-specific serine/threonine protein kinase n=1 Tax=Gigaspora rosea TaxID=44941 RepID=A0A397VV41_9GLOM|nr:hypothetical protein C2G38_2172765 [Gigaspora rosea]
MRMYVSIRAILVPIDKPLKHPQLQEERTGFSSQIVGRVLLQLYQFPQGNYHYNRIFEAPEVLLGQPYTKSSDIYSLGIIMTEILTGRRASDGNLQFKIIDRKRAECNHAPEFYVRLANNCMDNDPDKRQTATILQTR